MLTVNRRLSRVGIAPLLCLWSSLAMAEIQLPAKIEVAKTIEEGSAITLRVLPEGVPEEAKPKSTKLLISGKAEAIPKPDAEHIEYFVWASVGRHIVTAKGIWVVTKKVETVDGTTEEVLVDIGWYEETEIIVWDNANPDPYLGNMLVRLQADTDNVWLVETDASDDILRRYVAMVDERLSLPVYFVVDKAGKVYRHNELPETETAIRELLK